ncbi:MAG TPA: VTT domain-containing protein [bacterium]|jgi:uncharacterized membrane protein YdjX (TVP38/TMEM64 family)|nr:VTT domain-containing protein [bacterium]
MESPQAPLIPPPAKALSALLGGVGVLLAWRLAWVIFIWHLSGLRPSLESFVLHRQELENWNAAMPLQAWTAFLLGYTLVCALCLDGTATLVVVAGAIFGMGKGLALCTLGSSLGALAAFLFARRFLGAWTQSNFPKTVAFVDKGLKEDGDAWLLSARMIPMVSYSLVNLVMGLSDMSGGRFLLLSTLGLLPCNAAYVWAGVHLGRVHASGDLLSPSLWASLCILGVLPLLLRLIRRLPNVLKRSR